MRMLGEPHWIGVSALMLLLAALSAPRPVVALPIFARQYQVSCAKCHSVIPHLNEFGAAFLASGYRIPGLQPGPAFPLATKVNLSDSSQNQGNGPDGAGLPKAIVDEVELFTAGAIGSRGSYLVEQYALDGGMPGSTRDAWVMDRVNPWPARIPLYVQAGSFTLPLPVDPETFRDTAQHYTIYDQTVGTNPFKFFDPKIGVHVSAGDPLHGFSGQFFAGPGHDRQSGIASTGIDTMAYAQESMGLLTLAAYRYNGTRPTPYGPKDEFRRTGVGLMWNQWGRFSSETVLQNGWDSNCVGGLFGCSSSGGFTQLRYQFNRRLYVGGRYEGTADSTGGFARDTVFLLGWGPSEHSRFTIEDIIQHVPQTTHTMNFQFTFAE